jgi:hypothetical protein
LAANEEIPESPARRQTVSTDRTECISDDFTLPRRVSGNAIVPGTFDLTSARTGSRRD